MSVRKTTTAAAKRSAGTKTTKPTAKPKPAAKVATKPKPNRAELTALRAAAKAALEATKATLAEYADRVRTAAITASTSEVELGSCLYQAGVLIRDNGALGFTFPEWLDGYSVKQGRKMVSVPGAFPGAPKPTLDRLLRVGRVASIMDETHGVSSYALGPISKVLNRKGATDAEADAKAVFAKAVAQYGKPTFAEMNATIIGAFPDLADGGSSGPKVGTKTGNGKGTAKGKTAVTDPPKTGDRALAISQLDRLMGRIGGGPEQVLQVLIIVQETSKIAENVGPSTLYAVASERLKVARIAAKKTAAK